jgi:adenylate cyclase
MDDHTRPPGPKASVVGPGVIERLRDLVNDTIPDSLRLDAFLPDALIPDALLPEGGRRDGDRRGNRLAVGAVAEPVGGVSVITGDRGRDHEGLPALRDPATAAPMAGEGEPLAVDRAFAFVDICAFTAYCDQHGEAAAVEVLTRFRSVTRHVVGQRGVRVAKWLGDGVMLVGTDLGPLVAAVVELVARFRATGLETHVGIAAGDVLLFEGDDYVGRTVNLAARLSEAAGPGEILAADPLPVLPAWIDHLGRTDVQVVGMGRLSGVHRLGVGAEVAARLRGTDVA